MNKATAEAIGRTLGTVEQVDASPTGEYHGRYLRVRITLDINQPLCRGRMVNVGEMEPQWVSFQYERLPIFCYWCGHLNHDEKDCSLWTDSGGTLNIDDQQYGAWLRASTTNLQQPQVVNCNNKPNINAPRGPPHLPRQKPSPTTEQASETAAGTEASVPKPTSTDMAIPSNPESVTLHSPTNMEILANLNLFNVHITEIDNDLKNFPNTSQSTTPLKAGTDSADPLAPCSPNLVHPIIPVVHVSTPCLTDTQTKHVLNPEHVHSSGPKNVLNPAQGTWKRIRPPKLVLDTKPTTLLSTGPKRKTEDMSTMHDSSLDKKQKLDEEAKSLGKIMADNLGSAVATWQHRRVQ
ncbi:hypothetical protein CFP56_034518 [Quercus suber]|uniref:Zinc knuckle CX2CX4HX4C domain-containing protein n=1 Tax=Quercus suber TaxID=58331 RepID=A0AAW0LRP6_QUESU